jgi:hypothetical protein
MHSRQAKCSEGKLACCKGVHVLHSVLCLLQYRRNGGLVQHNTTAVTHHSMMRNGCTTYVTTVVFVAC